MSFIKHLLYIVMILVGGSLMLHFFGLPTPLELMRIFIQTFSVPVS